MTILPVQQYTSSKKHYNMKIKHAHNLTTRLV